MTVALANARGAMTVGAEQRDERSGARGPR
jgi:hypothetical protein